MHGLKEIRDTIIQHGSDRRPHDYKKYSVPELNGFAVPVLKTLYFLYAPLETSSLIYLELKRRYRLEEYHSEICLRRFLR